SEIEGGGVVGERLVILAAPGVDEGAAIQRVGRFGLKSHEALGDGQRAVAVSPAQEHFGAKRMKADQPRFEGQGLVQLRLSALEIAGREQGPAAMVRKRDAAGIELKGGGEIR